MVPPPSKAITLVWAALYVFSGICQPLLMTVSKEAGLADSTAQLYMFFYYLGPSLFIFTLIRDKDVAWPSRDVLTKACMIALYDIVAAILNYTGAGLAGPTLFAIIYSSVTIWTAVFSRIFLRRSMYLGQWVAVFLVFGGLSITATDSIHLGPDVSKGTVLVVLGSIMHGSAYVMSEAIMTVAEQPLTARQNAGIQGTVACLALGLWQLLYTVPRWEELIEKPMDQAGTTVGVAFVIMASFALANLVHSIAFNNTLKYYPGGATSAGVMKGLQAVLVFVAAHVIYCGRIGGNEMCFSSIKLASLLTVSGGVTVFGVLTEHADVLSKREKEGYSRVESVESREEQEGVEVEELAI